jgi:hypothetical protein
MDPTEKRKLLVNIRDIKLDLYALKEYVDRVNAQKMGKLGTTLSLPPVLSTDLPTAEERAELQLAGGKRKASSKKRKSKKRKSKKRKSKTRRRR